MKTGRARKIKRKAKHGSLMDWPYIISKDFSDIFLSAYKRSRRDKKRGESFFSKISAGPSQQK